MDTSIIAAIISAIVIIIISVAFLREPQPGARLRVVQQTDGGPGIVQAVRNQPAGMRANAARHQAVLEEEADQWEEVEQEAEADAADNAEEAAERLLEELTPEEEEELIRFYQEEYEALNNAFTLVEKAYDNEENYEEDLIKDLVVYIQDKKVCVHEELTALFKLKTPEAIERITELQASSELFGVIDNKGKFMYML